MSYKNSSQFGSHLPSDSSDESIRKPSFSKVKSNADIFEERGTPWYGDVPVRTPPKSPVTGELRMSRRAHLYNLLHPEVERQAPREDLSFSTEHCRPIDIRLAKEHNTLIPPLNAASKPSSRRRDLLVDVASKLRAKRAQHLVKVK